MENESKEYVVYVIRNSENKLASGFCELKNLDENIKKHNDGLLRDTKSFDRSWNIFNVVSYTNYNLTLPVDRYIKHLIKNGGLIDFFNMSPDLILTKQQLNDVKRFEEIRVEETNNKAIEDNKKRLKALEKLKDINI